MRIYGLLAVMPFIVGHSPAFQVAWQEPDLLTWIFSQRKPEAR